MLRPFAPPVRCMLLRFVESCCTKFETDQTFSYVQTDAKVLQPFSRVAEVTNPLIEIKIQKTINAKKRRRKTIQTLTTVGKARKKALRGNKGLQSKERLRVGLQPHNIIVRNSDN